MIRATKTKYSKIARITILYIATVTKFITKTT